MQEPSFKQQTKQKYKPNHQQTGLPPHSACNEGDLGSIPGLERAPGEWHGYPIQCSCLECPHGQRSLPGYSPWDRKELNMTQCLRTAHSLKEI